MLGLMSRKAQQFRRIKHGDPGAKLRGFSEYLRRRPRKRGRSVFGMAAAPIAAMLIGGIAVAWDQSSFSFVTAPLGLVGGDCTIKGNVSIDTGERIYHVPGQKYYEETRISRKHGDRWFCSESEARQAGWRRSRV